MTYMSPNKIISSGKKEGKEKVRDSNEPQEEMDGIIDELRKAKGKIASTTMNVEETKVDF